MTRIRRALTSIGVVWSLLLLMAIAALALFGLGLWWVARLVLALI